MHDDQPSARKVREEAEEKVAGAVTEALDAGVPAPDLRSAVAQGIDRYYHQQKRLVEQEVVG